MTKYKNTLMVSSLAIAQAIGKTRNHYEKFLNNQHELNLMRGVAHDIEQELVKHMRGYLPESTISVFFEIIREVAYRDLGNK